MGKGHKKPLCGPGAGEAQISGSAWEGTWSSSPSPPRRLPPGPWTTPSSSSGVVGRSTSPSPPAFPVPHPGPSPALPVPGRLGWYRSHRGRVGGPGKGGAAGRQGRTNWSRLVKMVGKRAFLFTLGTVAKDGVGE